ncbi:hypothetical protein Pst134EA_003381 [Puccinia striiformis f. sp. tritici]|uniref:hypothetical protein n=1 Tax=Puccinia striiformis f. sp. tritici TaxID=168172 RepID=UPI002007B36C|nr:hypothetical protein Pst134EA_003381 [Puccinia striiformis f. sp. tritici]KAH9472777.1 hypothetical protein Pst134EA_003381 [Puccinia striiformis f. sp. tritici]
MLVQLAARNKHRLVHQLSPLQNSIRAIRFSTCYPRETTTTNKINKDNQSLSLYHSQPHSKINQEKEEEDQEILPEYLASEESLSTSTKPVDEKHAVVSTFDLFSIGIGPSSSHTVGPMRAAKIFTNDLKEAGVLERVKTLKVALYGSLAATGKGHMSPEALMAGFEGHSCEDVDTASIPTRYKSVCENKTINLGLALDPMGIGHSVRFDIEKDLVWLWDCVLPQHPNGMLFSVYDAEGDLIANNTYFSIGGGFVVNTETQFSGENLYYKQIDKKKASTSRIDPFKQLQPLVDSFPLHNQIVVHNPDPDPNPFASKFKSSSSEVKDGPPFPFHNCDSLLELTRKHNLTIAQIVYNNEREFFSDDEIRERILKIYTVMDDSIKQGVTSEEDVLPGRLRVKRRARNLYRRLHRGFFPSVSDISTTPPPRLSFTKPNMLPVSNENGVMNEVVRRSEEFDSDDRSSLTPESNTTIHFRGKRRAPLLLRGQFDHHVQPVLPRRMSFPSMDFLSCYAIAVNEVNAAGGRIVTAPTNGAAGVLPSVLKYFLEFISEDPENDTMTFLLTAAAIGMLYKRGATISAAEGGCMAEVCPPTSIFYSSPYPHLSLIRLAWLVRWLLVLLRLVWGGSPEVIEAAAEIGIEHCLGLTCDPIDGLVQIPCIERNALGAVKAVTAAQLALSGNGVHSVSLDEAIAAMRQTAKDMSSKYKETSRAGLATSVKGARISVTVPDC